MSDTARLEDIFARACELPPGEREGFVSRECADDAALSADLLQLLTAHDRAAAETFWQRNAFEHEARASADAVDPAIGTRIGSYRLTAVLGRGGMGTVYRATRDDAEFEQSVAVKRLLRGMDASQIVARFRAERQILARLEHPNIARLIDGGTDDDGLPYLVMEYVDGATLAAYCDAHRLSIRARLALFRQICSAVHYAHQRMVVHRDLKPGNVLVTTDGVVKLLDFGIAKILATDAPETAAPTQAGMRMLTVRYASPEQIRGETVTSASDVYSLGVILYELLTGESPYPNLARPMHELMRVVSDEEPARPSRTRTHLRGDLDNIVLKALKKDPQQRYASADQFSDDVRRYLDGLPVAARGDAWSYVTAKFVRRHRIAVGAAALVVVTLVAGIVMTRRAEARAERRFNDVRALAHSVIFDYHDAIQDLPGSTPVRQRLVHDALQYLDSLSAEADDPSLERELVDAYVRISNVQGNSYNANLGDTAGAIASAKKAVAGAEQLLKRDRHAASLRSAASAFSVEGALVYGAGDLSGAETRLTRAVDLDEQAMRADPNQLATAFELADNLRRLGDLYGGPGIQNLGRTTEAIASYTRAAAVGEEESRRHPDEKGAGRDHYQSLLALAAAETSIGHAAEASAGFHQALATIEKVSAADPNNTVDRMELSNTSLRIGMQLMDDRRSAEAIPFVERSAAILEVLSAADPQATLYKRNLSVVENHLARALCGAGRPADALPHNQRSLSLAEGLSTTDSASTELKSDVAISHRKMAETMLALGNVHGALDHASIAARTLETIVTAAPDASLEAQWGRALLAEGDAHAALGNCAAAIDSDHKAEEIAARLSARDGVNAVLRSDLARSQTARAACLVTLGYIDEARDVYRHGLDVWADLDARHALTADDAYRRDRASEALAIVNARIAAR